MYTCLVKRFSYETVGSLQLLQQNMSKCAGSILGGAETDTEDDAGSSTSEEEELIETFAPAPSLAANPPLAPQVPPVLTDTAIAQECGTLPSSGPRLAASLQLDTITIEKNGTSMSKNGRAIDRARKEPASAHHKPELLPHGEASHALGPAQGDEDNVFGVKYTPTASSASEGEGYVLPSGPAFADEKEFDRALRGSAMQQATSHSMASVGESGDVCSTVADGDDDEFAGAFDENAHLMQDDRAGAAVARRGGAAPDAVSRADSKATSAGGEGEGGVFTEARRALNELHAVYASGAGDHEHELLEQAPDGRLVSSASASAPVEQIDVRGTLSGATIEEEDGDEEEEESAHEEEDPWRTGEQGTEPRAGGHKSNRLEQERREVAQEWEAVSELRDREDEQRGAAGARPGSLHSNSTGTEPNNSHAMKLPSVAAESLHSSRPLRLEDALAALRADPTCRAHMYAATYTVLYTDGQEPRQESMVLPERIHCGGITLQPEQIAHSAADLAAMGDLMPTRAPTEAGRSWTCVAAEQHAPVEVAVVAPGASTLCWPGRPGTIHVVHRIVRRDCAGAAGSMRGRVGGGLSACLGCVGLNIAGRGGNDALGSAVLRSERDLILAIAECEFQTSSGALTHARIMQTVYSGLTRTTHRVPMTGALWADLGFQRDDGFVTDLRAAGMLAPLLTLAFLEQQREMALRIFALCAEQGRSLPTGPPPFMCIAINFTQFVKLLLRSGSMDSVARSSESVVRAVCDMFFAHWLEFLEWRLNEPTELDARHIDMLRQGKCFSAKHRDKRGRSTGLQRGVAARIQHWRRHTQRNANSADTASSGGGLQQNTTLDISATGMSDLSSKG